MAEKPIDLFKAIFEDGSDSSDGEESQEAGPHPPQQASDPSRKGHGTGVPHLLVRNLVGQTPHHPINKHINIHNK